MATFFMVGQIEHQYDDNIYTSDGRGSEPIKLFKTEKAAKMAAQILTARKFQGSDENEWSPKFTDHFFNTGEVVGDEDKFYEILAKYGVDQDLGRRDEKDAINNAIAKMTEEDLVDLIGATSLEFFTVSEVEVADSAVALLTSPESWERQLGERLQQDKDTNSEEKA